MSLLLATMKPSASLLFVALLGSFLSAAPTAFAGPKGHDNGHGHGHGHGGGVSVPEINGQHAAGALALLVGGAAVIAGRRRRQRA
ncbi:MAG TPA: hypothetical protein VHB79_28095 [Polyangiaceae bacterium]|nr:hypothetical protein [Polyangiaceae bacterium]